jgi:energy-coupling factor transporter ATP-binding protein EcfA2
MLQAKRAPVFKEPYPGLRAFEANEALLFHGRARHTDDLLRRLVNGRFLAVVGGSGSGKSSLVRAGLLPALYRGYLVGATSRWRVAVMRPGSSPLDELCKALSTPEALGSVDPGMVRESSFGLVNAVRAASLAEGESLLLVVDQFEEIFRFRREKSDEGGGAEAALFVSQLLQACDTFGTPIYVTITMRSDFLGDCAEFSGLPEALNTGQYLIPRMTRGQRAEAITEALDFFDATISDRLVQRLLNDVGDDPDQLPVMQHALQQTWREWDASGRRDEIDIAHYEAAGTMNDALHRHAQRVYESIPEDNRWLAERIFRCVTVNENGRAVRRPRKLDRILRVIGVADDLMYQPAALEIMQTFANPANSFLVSSAPIGSDGEAVIDISHESLIRKWRTLAEWDRAEMRLVDMYRYLRRDAGLYPAEAALWGDPELANALKAREDCGWNYDWAEQYTQGAGPSFLQVEKFLDDSKAHREDKRRREAMERRLRIAFIVLMAAIVLGGLKFIQMHFEQAKTVAALKELESTAQTLKAEKAAIEAKSKELMHRIDTVAPAAKAGDTGAAEELERLRKEQELTKASLREREKLIQSNARQQKTTSQDYAESLKTINDLQAKLDQAWKERDNALSELRLTQQKDYGNKMNVQQAMPNRAMPTAK